MHVKTLILNLLLIILVECKRDSRFCWRDESCKREYGRYSICKNHICQCISGYEEVWDDEDDDDDDFECREASMSTGTVLAIVLPLICFLAFVACVVRHCVKKRRKKLPSPPREVAFCTTNANVSISNRIANRNERMNNERIHRVTANVLPPSMPPPPPVVPPRAPPIAAPPSFPSKPPRIPPHPQSPQQSTFDLNVELSVWNGPAQPSAPQRQESREFCDENAPPPAYNDLYVQPARNLFFQSQ